MKALFLQKGNRLLFFHSPLALPSHHVVSYLPMDKKTYFELRHKIEDDASKKIEALDIVWKLLNEDNKAQGQESSFSEQPHPQASGTVSLNPVYEGGKSLSTNDRSEKINLAQEVREAVHETEGRFTQQSITQRVRGKYPNADVRAPSVSNTLARLVKRGSVKRVRKGLGSEPNIYRKSEAWSFEEDVARNFAGDDVTEEVNE